MSKTTDTSPHTAGPAQSGAVRAETPFDGELVALYAQAGRALLERAVAFNEEVLRFANERLSANPRMFQDLPACADWQQAAKLQSDFVRAETEAYLAEMPKLTEEAMRTCTAAWTPGFESPRARAKAGEMK